MPYNYKLFQDPAWKAFHELHFEGGTITPSSPSVLAIIHQAEHRGIDISIVEKVLWNILIFPFTIALAGPIGLILGLGIPPLVYFRALKWRERLHIMFLRSVLYLRLKQKVSRSSVHT